MGPEGADESLVSELDAQNAAFWDELCGTHLARSVGITGHTRDDLARFDRAYLDFYPYLEGYVPRGLLDGVRVLEVGLGYGTLGQVLVDRGATYTGVDIAPGPVAMMQRRIHNAGAERRCEARQASVLALPFDDGAFDMLYSIGCLHHTGDLEQSVAEVHRVLRPGGMATVMLYNRWSARRVLQGVGQLLRGHRPGHGERVRATYDADIAGAAAPHTDFISVRGARNLFSGFRSTRVHRRNVASIPHVPMYRRVVLASRLDQLVGLDLYIRATS